MDRELKGLDCQVRLIKVEYAGKERSLYIRTLKLLTLMPRQNGELKKRVVY